MQIAEHHNRKGMTGSEAFCDKIKEVITDYSLTKIIETGTYHGQGTTRAVIDALQATGGSFDFYSIEVNPVNYRIASVNIGKVVGFHLLNGLSVSKRMIPTSATYNVPDYVFVDHEDQHRDRLYYNEVNHEVPDNQLDLALKRFGFKPDLVILDSAGHMGMIEFRYLMERVTTPFILCLDDTCHIKHYDTMEFIRDNPKDFEILWQVESEYLSPESGSKFGSAIIQVK